MLNALEDRLGVNNSAVVLATIKVRNSREPLHAGSPCVQLRMTYRGSYQHMQLLALLIAVQALMLCMCGPTIAVCIAMCTHLLTVL